RGPELRRRGALGQGGEDGRGGREAVGGDQGGPRDRLPEQQEREDTARAQQRVAAGQPAGPRRGLRGRCGRGRGGGPGRCGRGGGHDRPGKSASTCGSSLMRPSSFIMSPTAWTDSMLLSGGKAGSRMSSMSCSSISV